MFHALLATIGTLAILASIVAKIVVSRAVATACDVAGEDGLPGTVQMASSTRSIRACRRGRRRARVCRHHIMANEVVDDVADFTYASRSARAGSEEY